MSKLAAALTASGWTRIATLGAIVAVTIYRIMPHLPNLSPVGAMFVLGGLYLGGGLAWMAAPFACLLISDAVLDVAFNGQMFYPARVFDYGAFLAIGLGARFLANKPAAARIGAVMGAPVVFFLISNFGVWVGSYPHTASGLMACYTAALPFFRGTLFGDWLFAGVGMLMIEGLRSRQARAAAAAA